nr:hypothetical protein [Clostridia bacterium]
MFSSISPDYERNLKDELYGCFKYIGIPFDILNKMPIRDRKFYIAKHNGIVEDEIRKERGDSRIDGEMINKFTDYSQLSDINSRNR